MTLGEDGSWVRERASARVSSAPSLPAWMGRCNTLYMATKRIRLGGRTLNVPGAGVFPEAKEMFRLTVRGENCSLWKVPSWLNPRVGLSYHRDPARWGRGILRVVARGQEFVADVDDNPDAFAWLEELFRNTKYRLRPTYQFETTRPPRQPRGGRIWRYVEATDSGYAPCVYRRMLSLCICKPFIRLGAEVGDWVIGFMRKRFGPRVIWAGRVSEILPMGQYYMRYSRRPDAIYNLLRITPDGREVLEHIGVAIHADKKSQERDVRGKNALVFREFWYWGENAPQAPARIARLAYYRQGQTTRGAGPKEAAHLEKWLSQWTPGVHGPPRDAVKTRSKGHAE